MSAEDRRALLIGIREYPFLPAHQQLAGCVHDVERMARLLQDRFGFPPTNIDLVRDSEATRDGVLAALDRLVDATAPGDVVLVHYSGHGSQEARTDPGGDELVDETIVPYDSGRGAHPSRDIRDDELHERVLRLSAKTDRVTLVLDACHSGGLDRSAFGARPRFVEPARPLPPRARPRASCLRRRVSGVLPGALAGGQRYVLLAGCGEGELSYEHVDAESGAAFGALSYFLHRELLAARRGSTYRDVFERVAAQVTALYPKQHPELEGTADRELFGVRDIRPMVFVDVKERLGERAVLGAGAAHGVTLGSAWAVYPAGAKSVEAQAPLGRLQIRAVHSLSSAAVVVQESSPGAVTAGARAVEIAQRAREARLRVGFEEAASSAREACAASALIEVTPAQHADVCVALRDGGGAGDRRWAVLGKSGRPLFEVPVDRPVLLLDGLEREARYRFVLALHNGDSRLAGQVALVLKQRAGDLWIEARPEPGEALPSFCEGDAVAVEIVNRHPFMVHVCLLDLGLDAQVTHVFPWGACTGSHGLDGGERLRIGEAPGEEIRLSIPRPAPERDVETFKLLVTSGPADFAVLTQPGFSTRCATEAFDAKLMGLFAAALSQRSSPGSGEPADDWTTVERSFRLRPRE